MERIDGTLVGQRHAHDVAASLGKRAHLGERGHSIRRIRAGHGLHHNARSPADLHATNIDLSRTLARKYFGNILRHMRPPNLKSDPGIERA